MASIRARLTATYAAALAGTMLVFGATLWIGRGAGVQRELERYAAVVMQMIEGKTIERDAGGFENAAVFQLPRVASMSMP